MGVHYFSRRDWGSSTATEQFFDRRYGRNRADVVCLQIHHTAAIDGDDNTPNRWDFDEALRYTRALQTARPDLMPMPYNETVAVSEDLEDVWFFEGAGLDKVGAHTSGHNRHGFGISVYGNFDRRDDAAAEVLLRAINTRAIELQRVFPNLGSELSPNGWRAWGHRDSKNKSCPGGTLYPSIPRFVTFETEEETVDKYTARLAIVGAFIRNTGTVPTPGANFDRTEDRLDELSLQVVRGERSIDDIDQALEPWRPSDLAAKLATLSDSALPVWALVPKVPATGLVRPVVNVVSQHDGFTVEEILDIVEEHIELRRKS